MAIEVPAKTVAVVAWRAATNARAIAAILFAFSLLLLVSGLVAQSSFAGTSLSMIAVGALGSMYLDRARRAMVVASVAARGDFRFTVDAARICISDGQRTFVVSRRSFARIREIPAARLVSRR